MSYAVRLLISVFFLLFSSGSCFSQQLSVSFGSQRVSDEGPLVTPQLGPGPTENTENPKISALPRGSSEQSSFSVPSRPLTLGERQNISQLCREHKVPSEECKTH